MLKLRDYQTDAVEAVFEDITAGVKRPSVVLPTGAGKTVVFSHLIQRWQAEHGGRALVLAHREELVNQARDKYLSVSPEAKVGIVKAEQDDVHADVVMASVQTLARAHRRERLEGVNLVVVDECHHATAKSYLDVLDHFGGVAVGFTATMARGDGRALGTVWEKISYERSILRMIRDRYLVDVRGVQVRVPDLDLTGVRKTAGDYREGDLGERLMDSMAPETVAKAYREHAADLPGILFAPTVQTAHAFTDALVAEGFTAATVWGAMPADERRQVLADFDAGKIQILSNCMVLCLDTETEILTDRGWARHDQMTPDHKVANWNQGEVFFEKPLEIVRRPLGRHERMYRLLTRGRDVRVTGGHRMLYRTSQSQSWSKTAVENLAGKNVLIPTTGRALPFSVRPEMPACPKTSRQAAINATAYNLRRREGYSFEESRIEAARRVDRRRGLRYLDPAELTLDQCRFIGFWIGDGSINHPARGGVEYTASQSVSYSKIIEWFDAVIESCDLQVTRRENTHFDVPHVRWSFPRGTGGGTQERNGIFSLEPYLDKDGSELLWGLNAKQFDALLEGLWYADGNHGQAEAGYPIRWQIYATRKNLLDLLQAIGTVRGMNLTVRSCGEPRKNDHSELWALTRSASIDHRTARHRFELDPAPWRPEEVWCVKTTTRNIITRRNGTVTVMGNTEGFDSPRATCCVIARPTASAPLYVQMVGRVLRLWPGKGPALVLDVVGAAGKHELATLNVLAGDKKIKELKPGQTLLKALDELEAEQAEAEESGYVGDVVAAEVDLFGGSRQQWLQTKGGHWFLPAGNRFIVLMPIKDSTAVDVAWAHSKTKGGGWIARNIPDLGYAMAQGESAITDEEEVLARKEGAWRKRRATQVQLAFAKDLRIDIPEDGLNGLRAGALGDMISIELASRRMDRAIAARLR